jgi:hypothetical protein
VACCCHYGLSTEGAGGTEDRPDIVRIRNLVQHHDELRLLQVIQPEAADWIDFKRNTLVHRVSTQKAVQLLGGCLFNPQAFDGTCLP